MTSIDWLYELTILLYALSILGYFIDFLQNNRKANKFAFWLLSIVWGLQLLLIIIRMMETDRFPILTQFEGLLFYAWIIITFSLIVNWFFKVDFLVFFTNLLGFSIMSLALLTPGDQNSELVSENLVSHISVIHITMAFISYGAFTLSFIFSIMYLLQHNMLKKKLVGKRFWRFESLLKLEKLSLLLNIIGVPLLFFSLVLGIIYANAKLDVFIWFDVKVISSFFVLLIYSLYFYQKISKGIQGYSLALLNIAAFLLVLINYFLATTFTTFHFWI
jgi:HemX protein